MARDKADADLYEQWLNYQQQFGKLQETWQDTITNSQQYWRSTTPSSPPWLQAWAQAMGSAKPDQQYFEDSLNKAASNWSAWERQFQDWLQASSHWIKHAKNDDENGFESLQKMLDPSAFAQAAMDELSSTIQHMVEGPGFSDFGVLEREGLRATQEWMNLRQAEHEYRQVTGAAWARAFMSFSEDVARQPDTLQKTPRELLKQWLQIANEELIATQRSDEYLKVQRKLLRAGSEYRLKQRAVMEMWCEAFSIPSRSEVDDLQKTVSELRRELRTLKRRLADSGTTTPESRTAPKKKSASRSKRQAKKASRSRRRTS